MINKLDSELRLRETFQRASTCRKTQELTDSVLTEIGTIPLVQGDSRLRDSLASDVALKMSGRCGTGELGEIIAQLNPQFLGDQDGCNIRVLEEVVAQRVIGGVLFHNEPLTPVKAGILATVTRPGDPRVREVVEQKLNQGGLDWAVVQALQL